ncbi:MAG: metal-sensitive transcriptional regulator [Candidatus Doudnabacteria bacterium]|nr:metal-sensitive transcriptional regulator [Candidatus Doudnabacteria bacterium]
MRLNFKKQAINRLHRLQGQLRGLEKMVEENKYCPEILTQVAAVQKSLQSFNWVIMENHLREHIVRAVRKGRIDPAVRELLELYKLSNPVV